jgi:hypothetical protein
MKKTILALFTGFTLFCCSQAHAIIIVKGNCSECTKDGGTVTITCDTDNSTTCLTVDGGTTTTNNCSCVVNAIPHAFTGMSGQVLSNGYREITFTGWN